MKRSLPPLIDPLSSRILLELRIIPNASIDRIVGMYGTALKIKIRAPALEGKANRALISFLSHSLSLSSAQLHLVSGMKSRAKRLEVIGISALEIQRRIEACLLQ